MKKSLGLFFFGIFAVATGIGCFSATFNNKNTTKVEAASNVSYLQFDENGIVKFGSYPQVYRSDISLSDLQNNGTFVEGTNSSMDYYIYNNSKFYVIETSHVHTNPNVDISSYYLSDGQTQIMTMDNKNNLVIEFKPIEWFIVEKYTDSAVLMPINIIDRHIFDDDNSVLEFLNSDLNTYLSTTFKYTAFSEDDFKYFSTSDKPDFSHVPIDIPSKDQIDLDKFKDDYLKQASDFAILNNLCGDSHYNHGVGVPFTNSAYWTKTIYQNNAIVSCFAKVAYNHNTLPNDERVGVRPLIGVHYKENSGGGGGTTPSKSSSGESGNVTLGIGISFTILGAGGLIAFFILWAKKHPSGKPPIWILASLAGSLVISVVGLGCLAGGMTGGGGASCFKYGYYVQTGQYGRGQVDYTAWLIKSDGTASYCSHITDTTNASDFAPDNYMTGTYKINGSKLVIDIPKHEIKNFGTIGGIYTYTIKGCENFQNSDGAYHWVRGE